MKVITRFLYGLSSSSRRPSDKEIVERYSIFSLLTTRNVMFPTFSQFFFHYHFQYNVQTICKPILEPSKVTKNLVMDSYRIIVYSPLRPVTKHMMNLLNIFLPLCHLISMSNVQPHAIFRRSRTIVDFNQDISNALNRTLLR